jgi:hypothetical protein
MTQHRHDANELIVYIERLAQHVDPIIMNNVRELADEREQRWLTVERCLHERLQSVEQSIQTWQLFNSIAVDLFDRFVRLQWHWQIIQQNRFLSNVDILQENIRVRIDIQ